MRSIKLMADYGCFPLWEAAAEGSTNLDPENLRLSPALKAGLDAWAAAYDATLNMDDPAASSFESPADEEQFRLRGLELADLLRAELGAGFIITVF
jgi:hypothetical protein